MAQMDLELKKVSDEQNHSNDTTAGWQRVVLPQRKNTLICFISNPTQTGIHRNANK